MNEPSTLTAYERMFLRKLMRNVRRCLDKPEQRRQFEEWYREQFGEEYTWSFLELDENGGVIGERK